MLFPRAALGEDEPKPKIVIYHVDGLGGLRVTVRYQTLSGQWHLAEKLSFTVPGATPLVLRPKYNEDGFADGEMVPLIGRIEQIDPQRWLVLGWSSWGEGLQRDDAWIIEARDGKVRVVDRLEVEGSRRFVALAVDSTLGRQRVGLPHPPPIADAHRPGQWQLRVSGKSIGFRGMRALVYREERLRELKPGYAPPTDAPPWQRGWDGRIAWFDVRPEGFRPTNPEERK